MTIPYEERINKRKCPIMLSKAKKHEYSLYCVYILVKWKGDSSNLFEYLKQSALMAHLIIAKYKFQCLIIIKRWVVLKTYFKYSLDFAILGWYYYLLAAIGQGHRQYSNNWKGYMSLYLILQRCWEVNSIVLCFVKLKTNDWYILDYNI